MMNASRCSSCRLAGLRLAISTADTACRPGLPLAPRYRNSAVHSRRTQQQYRAYSQSRPILSDYVPQNPIPQRVDVAENESTAACEDGDRGSASPTGALPWYLQVEIPQQAPQPISDRQRIPEQPVASPPLLRPLLEHISVDLGLDDLSTIDLRNLDPPPALGANLIMILSTARSEKHLHVSADRLCRWLRSNHKLTPFADGLLGRNELKLKLKRKARRSKLLGSVGALERDVADDGVRTGWICVNIGTVEGKGSEIDEAVAVDSFVGFGSRSQSVRLVVQMLTKEKREEVDLEGLWRGLLEHKAHRDAKTDELVKRATGSRATETHISTGTSGMSYASPAQGAHFQSLSRAQTRRFHTATTYLTKMPSLQASTNLRDSSPMAKE